MVCFLSAFGLLAASDKVEHLRSQNVFAAVLLQQSLVYL